MLSITSIVICAALAVAAVSDGPAFAAGVNAGPSAIHPASELIEQAEIRPVDVNAATADELQKVPGIGEALARRIIEFREEHGPFQKIDDLLNVRGIGATSLEKLRPYLVVKRQG